MSEQGNFPDFKGLTRRLTAVGLIIFAEFSLGGKEAVIPGTGLSVEDFVEKTLVEYAVGKIKHNKSRGSLMTVLGTAMRNDVIDALRKKSHEREESREAATRSEDLETKEDVRPTIDDYPQSLFADPSVLVDEDEYRERVRESVGDEPALKEVVEAVLDLQLYKPEEIADALGTSASDIQNRKKKLRRRLCAGELVNIAGNKAKRL